MQRQGARGRRLSFFTNGIHQGSKGTVHSCYFWNQFFQCQILGAGNKNGRTNQRKNHQQMSDTQLKQKNSST